VAFTMELMPITGDKSIALNMTDLKSVLTEHICPNSKDRLGNG